MRTIHYGIRLAIVLIAVALFYLGVSALLHQSIQLPVLLTLLFITFGTERLWALLGWLSPIIGKMGTREQESRIEYELARSQRYNSHLVVVAIREKTHTPLHIIAQNLRTTDIVLRGTANYLLVLMPGITLEQASLPLQRLMSLLPIKDMVVADEQMLQALVKAHKANLNGKLGHVNAAEFRKITLQAFDAKCAHIKSGENEDAEPTIYHLLEMPQTPDLPDRKIRS